MTYVKVLSDPHWWPIHKKVDGKWVSTGVLVPVSRLDDPKFSKSFPGGTNDEGERWSAYPGVRPLFSRPSGGGGSLRLPQRWWDKVREINTPAIWEKLRTMDYGWLNSAGNREYRTGDQVLDNPDLLPRPEAITSLLNVHRVVEKRNGATRIEAYRFSDPVPDILDEYKVCDFTSIDEHGNIVKMGAKFPLLVAEEAWIPDEALEEVPKETETMLPEIGDYSRHNGETDLNVAKQNGVLIAIIRAGISWGYQDAWFPANWQKAIDALMYRTSYHVIYTNQPIVKQADNWYKVQPERDVLPRDIDLEVDMGDEPKAKAEAVWNMSNLVLSRDGVRPLIYSRYQLINAWLASWSDEMKNDHYYHLAQYSSDRTKEHPGPPTLPDGVLRERVLIHQTADKIPGYPGEVQSAARDKNRWQLGDEAQMHAFIAAEFGGGSPPPPPVDNLPAALDDMQAVVDKWR